MALFNFFKRTKKVPQAPKAQKISDRAVVRKTEGKKARPVNKQVVLRESKTAWRILREPHVTEKATDLTHFNQYSFKVLNNPSKPEIKKSVEEVYNVHVDKVRKISITGKKTRRGRHIGWRSGYKKAIVTLRKGEKIEVLPH